MQLTLEERLTLQRLAERLYQESRILGQSTCGPIRNENAREAEDALSVLTRVLDQMEKPPAAASTGG